MPWPTRFRRCRGSGTDRPSSGADGRPARVAHRAGTTRHRDPTGPAGDSPGQSSAQTVDHGTRTACTPSPSPALTSPTCRPCGRYRRDIGATGLHPGARVRAGRNVHDRLVSLLVPLTRRLERQPTLPHIQTPPTRPTPAIARPDRPQLRADRPPLHADPTAAIPGLKTHTGHDRTSLITRNRPTTPLHPRSVNPPPSSGTPHQENLDGDGAEHHGRAS